MRCICLSKQFCFNSNLASKFHIQSMTMKPVVFVTRNIPEHGQLILANADIELRQWQSDDPVPRNILLENVKEADGLLCLLTDKIDEQLLDHCQNQLKVISTMSVGEY